jgi:hypothetical protein
MDIGPPTLVTGVITKGRADTRKKHWVKRFKISYSNDTNVWYFYKDAHHLDPKVGPRLLLYYLTNIDILSGTGSGGSEIAWWVTEVETLMCCMMGNGSWKLNVHDG